MANAFLAIDLGASSGRAIVGTVVGNLPRITIEEVHRFQHHSCTTPRGPIWDLTGIWQNILRGLSDAQQWCQANGHQLTSIGVDTWGVDYVLLTKDGELLSPPHCYRDPRNDAACEIVLDRLGGFPKLYERTGIQRLPFNTLFQLVAQREATPSLFDVADRMLFLPDLFHYWLSGEMSTEITIASTSSMLRANDGTWDTELVQSLDLPTEILGELIEPGTCVGNLRAEIAEELGVDPRIRVVAPASHDTASAVAAVPAVSDQSWAYLSSGTWSLLGAELRQPVLTEEACRVPFTNERGAGNTIRFLKNISGLWIVQELRKAFLADGHDWTYAELTQMARDHGPTSIIVDADAPSLLQPGQMAEKIRQLAVESGQPAPATEAGLVRCVLQSLAASYHSTLVRMEAVLGKRMDVVHVVGGGVKNELLNSLAESAIGRPVLRGPAEVTAMGNLLLQAIGCGDVADLPAARTLVANSANDSI